MSNPEKRVAIYCRVASHDEMALTLQTERMKDFVAGKAGWVLTGVYCDEAASAAVDERSGLQKLLSDAKAQAFDAVAVYSFSRLARSRELLESINRTLNGNGIEIESATGEVLLRFSMDSNE